MTNSWKKEKEWLVKNLREINGSFCDKCFKPLFKGDYVLHHRNKDRLNNSRKNLNLLCDPCHREIHSCEEIKFLDLDGEENET